MISGVCDLRFDQDSSARWTIISVSAGSKRLSSSEGVIAASSCHDKHSTQKISGPLIIYSCIYTGSSGAWANPNFRHFYFDWIHFVVFDFFFTPTLLSLCFILI
jgi:hypothetical protein